MHMCDACARARVWSSGLRVLMCAQVTHNERITSAAVAAAAAACGHGLRALCLDFCRGVAGAALVRGRSRATPAPLPRHSPRHSRATPAPLPRHSQMMKLRAEFNEALRLRAEEQAEAAVELAELDRLMDEARARACVCATCLDLRRARFRLRMRLNDAQLSL